MRKRLLSGLVLLLLGVSSHAALIQVDFSELAPFTNLREFGDVGDFGLSQVSFGERFVGQITTFGGPVPERPNEILSGQPLSPLALETTGDNEGVCSNLSGNSGDRGISGRITDAQGNSISCGEGSVAILFGEDQSQIGIRIGDGPITLQFFTRDGNLLGLFDFNVAFGTEIGFYSSSADIAGFSFHNEDFAGTILPALYFGSESAVVPEPSTLALLAAGLVGMGFARRKTTP